MDKIACIIVLCVTMINTDVSAQMPNQQPPDVMKMADKYCAPSSIAISQSMVRQSASKRKESESSVFIDPVVKMQMRQNELLTIIALENLVTQCAILKWLSRGI